MGHLGWAWRVTPAAEDVVRVDAGTVRPRPVPGESGLLRQKVFPTRGGKER